MNGSFSAYWRELQRRVRGRAQQRNSSPQAELQQFVLQRIMARNFTVHPDSWMLKGGQGLLARWPDARATSDVDLVSLAGKGRQGMLADFTSALGTDLGDHLTFEQTHVKPLVHGEGARVGHIVHCGHHQLMAIETDLLPPNGRPHWREPELIPFPAQIMDSGRSDENPMLRALSVEDTLAHKVSGMYTQGLRNEETKCAECLPRAQGIFACRSGEMPYRVQDMVDVTFLASRVEWNAADTQAMLKEEFRLRLEQEEPLSVPAKFRLPNPTWAEGYLLYASRTPGLDARTLGEALPIAENFLGPLLGDQPAVGTWDPEQRAWQGAGTSVAEPSSGPDRFRVLVVAHASGRERGLGGLPVASGELTKALAGLENADVTLLTIGQTGEHGDAVVIPLPENAGMSAKNQILDVARHAWPEQIEGLPAAGSDSFDLVVGHSRFSGYAAQLIRQRWYPYAQLAYVVHMPIERYAEVQGDPERGLRWATTEKDVMANADVVVGVGPLLTDTARTAMADSVGKPNFHEMVPGIDTSEAVGPVRPSQTFNALFVAHRVNDAVKGYDDLLATVKELRDRGFPISLRVRGVPGSEVEDEQRRADAAIGRPSVVEILAHTTDPATLRDDREWAHVAVMPSRIEGYGLVGSEAAAQGMPVLVNAESGVGQFFADASRIPAEVGQHCVVPDAGMARNRDARVQAWGTALMELASDYPARRAAAGSLREVLAGYSWPDAARGLREAAAKARPGALRNTVQAANGAVREITGTKQEAAVAAGAGTGSDFVARFTQDISPTSPAATTTPAGTTVDGAAEVKRSQAPAAGRADRDPGRGSD